MSKHKHTFTTQSRKRGKGGRTYLFCVTCKAKKVGRAA